MRVLLVEDDKSMAALLERTLREEGDAVVTEHNGRAALALARAHVFDAIILNVMLPGLDGFAVVHGLRQRGCQTPVLMLAARNTNRDVIRGLNVGADDYLAKPFDLGVLIARVRAIARRGTLPLSVVLAVADLTLNTATREVERGGRVLDLTRTEYRLLELLIRNAGRVIPREQIVETVWGFDSNVENSTVGTFVHLLRRKVDTFDKPRLIQTVRGIGYSIRDKARG
ncbi:MAG: response regulator transcription factor [Bryobacterales bacterium]|nr:response regulator transcription factor [Bryobacterales bacterium]